MLAIMERLQSIRTGAISAEEEFSIAVDNSIEQGPTVLGGLSRGLAVVVLPNSQTAIMGGWSVRTSYHISRPVVYQERKMVGGLR